jgi:hypothetical protein
LKFQLGKFTINGQISNRSCIFTMNFEANGLTQRATTGVLTAVHLEINICCSIMKFK